MVPELFTTLGIPPEHLQHPPVPNLPDVSAPGEAMGGDPLGWWQLIGGAWRWVIYPDPD